MNVAPVPTTARHQLTGKPVTGRGSCVQPMTYWQRIGVLKKKEKSLCVCASAALSLLTDEP